MQGLALTVRKSLKRDPHADDFISSAGVEAILPKFFGMMASVSLVRQAPGPRKVHLAFGVGWHGVDLSGPDGLYAGRDRLEESATDMATAGRRGCEAI
jgi:hypothetical protein